MAVAGEIEVEIGGEIALDGGNDPALAQRTGEKQALLFSLGAKLELLQLDVKRRACAIGQSLELPTHRTQRFDDVAPPIRGPRFRGGEIVLAQPTASAAREPAAEQLQIDVEPPLVLQPQ